MRGFTTIIYLLLCSSYIARILYIYVPFVYGTVVEEIRLKGGHQAQADYNQDAPARQALNFIVGHNVRRDRTEICSQGMHNYALM